MARIGTNGSGKSDYYGTLGSLLSGFFVGQVATGLNVVAQTSPNMTVKVNPGIAIIPTGSGATASASLVRNDGSNESVTIATANGSNPRNDVIVGYYDTAVIDTANPNNPGAFKLVSVAGTPSATPADPSDSTIQAAVGAANPYIKLARVAVGTGVTQVTSASITDLRTMLGPVIPSDFVDYTKWTNKLSFIANMTAGTSVSGSTFTTMGFNKAINNPSGMFIESGNKVVIPIKGVYHFDAAIDFSAPSGNHRVILSLFVNGAETLRISDLSIIGATSRGAAGSGKLLLNAGDEVVVRGWFDAAYSLGSANGYASWFSGALVNRQ